MAEFDVLSCDEPPANVAGSRYARSWAEIVILGAVSFSSTIKTIGECVTEQKFAGALKSFVAEQKIGLAETFLFRNEKLVCLSP